MDGWPTVKKSTGLIQENFFVTLRVAKNTFYLRLMTGCLISLYIILVLHQLTRSKIISKLPKTAKSVIRDICCHCFMIS